MGFRFTELHSLFFLLMSQLVFLRVVLKYVLGVSIGWHGMTDYDLFIPGGVAFFCYFKLLQRSQPIPWNFARKRARNHLVSIFFFLLISVIFSKFALSTNYLLKFTWFSLLVLLMFSAVQVFIPLSFLYRNKNKWVLLPCLLIAFSTVIYQNSWEFLWPFFGQMTSGVLCKIFPELFLHGRCEFMADKTIILLTKHFRADLSPGCLGIDGQFLNFASCFLFFLVDSEPCGSHFLFFRWILGAIGVFILNIFRILIFVSVALVTLRTHWASWGARFFLDSFHMHLGWVLYLVFIYRLNLFFIRKRGVASSLACFKLLHWPKWVEQKA